MTFTTLEDREDWKRYKDAMKVIAVGQCCIIGEEDFAYWLLMTMLMLQTC